jgi:hypothetical protein
MLFADGFWEVKTIGDVVTLGGFVITVVSIWFSWWLAQRDIQQRILVAQQQTVDRLARSLLHPEVTETSRCLKEAREACRGQGWERAIDRCEQAKHRIPLFHSLPGLDDEDRSKLVLAVDQLRLLVNQLEEIKRKTRTELTPAKIKDLDDLIITLATIEGKIRSSGLR